MAMPKVPIARKSSRNRMVTAPTNRAKMPEATTAPTRADGSADRSRRMRQDNADRSEGGGVGADAEETDDADAHQASEAPLQIEAQRTQRIDPAMIAKKIR
jgi:hypothetical protein